VTVLFADLVGFTSLSERRDAEDTRDLLSHYFATARTVVSRYGGSIEKFIGDAVMAVWGVPLAQEDDAERAVRAALELVDAVSALGETVGAPGLRARAGVLTGEAAVNLGATGEGMVAGDMVNTASRVQTSAEPGNVLVGEATWRATEAAIRYADAGMHQLKGKPEPLRLWRATGVVAARGGALRPTALEPPFVGRDRELRMLKEILHATSEEGTARLLSITGVAGVGKSRLAWEFEKYVDGLTEGVWWHRGRCLSYGDGVAYSALAEMVRMRADIVENEAAESAQRKLKECVESFLPDAEERQWVEPRLAQLLGLQDVGANDPRDLYAAWRVFFERLATEGLTVLLFGDLQWADPGLLDFIDYLLDWSRTSRILILTLARPELAERRPGWGTGKRGFTSMYLEPLSAEAMDRLLEGMAPGLPDALAKRICQQAAGIPLYAVETVRMLLDRHLVTEHEGTYRAEVSVQELAVPESLHALIAARLDALSSEQRQLAQDAAVLGKAFTPSALSAITTLPPEVVETGLQALIAKDLLAIQSDPRSPERGQYVFVQDLVRTVAYGTLARRERKQRHLAVAEYLSRAWGDEDDIAEVVADHLVEAYQADPNSEDAPVLGERARSALVRAAERASSLGGPESACRYYEQAIELASFDARAELHLGAGRAASLLGQTERAQAHFEHAVDLFQDAGQIVAQAEALHDLSLIAARSGRRDLGDQSLERALALLALAPADDESTAATAKIEGLLARGLYFRGDLDGALQRVDRALRVADSRELWPVLALGLETKGNVLAARDQRFEAEILTSAALRIALDHGLIELGIRIATSLATLLEEADQIQASLEVYEQAEGLARRLGDRRSAIGAGLNRIWSLLEIGRWDEVAAVVKEYLEADAFEVGWEIDVLVIGSVWLYLRRGDLAAAHRIVDEPPSAATRADLRAIVASARAAVLNAEGEYEQALQLAEATLRSGLVTGQVADVGLALIESVDAAFALGRDANVVELIEVVREHYRPGRQPSLDAHILRWEARLAGGRSDLEVACQKFQAASEAFAGLSRPFWVAETRLEFAETLITQARELEARELLAQARATFAELGAQPWLERADAAMRVAMASRTTISA